MVGPSVVVARVKEGSHDGAAAHATGSAGSVVAAHAVYSIVTHVARYRVIAHAGDAASAIHVVGTATTPMQSARESPPTWLVLEVLVLMLMLMVLVRRGAAVMLGGMECWRR
jgi:hypothetical protein